MLYYFVDFNLFTFPLKIWKNCMRMRLYYPFHRQVMCVNHEQLCIVQTCYKQQKYWVTNLNLRGAPLDFQGGSRKFLEKKNHPLAHRFLKNSPSKMIRKKKFHISFPPKGKKKFPTSFHERKKNDPLWTWCKKKKIPFTIFKQTKKFSNGHHYNY